MHTIVETPSFSRDAEKLLSENELGDLLAYIALNPDCGDVIPGTGGFRKLRWGKGHRGKSGGVRTIHFYYAKSRPVYMAAIYGKNEKSNITKAEANTLAKLAKELKGESDEKERK